MWIGTLRWKKKFVRCMVKSPAGARRIDLFDRVVAHEPLHARVHEPIPQGQVRLEYLHPHRVLRSGRKRSGDVGLVSYPKASRTVKAMIWREEPMHLVCAPTNRFAKQKSVTLEQLDGVTMIGFDSDLTIRREIDRALQAHNAEVRVTMEFDNIETIKRALEIDAGVAFYPNQPSRAKVAAGTLVANPD